MPRNAISGLLLALLALACQLALGGSVLAEPAPVPSPQLAELAAISVICGSPVAGQPGAEHRHGGPQHRHQDCALCPLSLGLGFQAIVLAAPAVLPAPEASAPLRLAAGQGARAPPSHGSHPGLPRGPPVLA